HFVIDTPVLLDPGQLLRTHRKLLIDNLIHRPPIDQLKIQSLSRSSSDFPAAAAGQTGNRDDCHRVPGAIFRSLCTISGWTSGARRSKPVSLTKTIAFSNRAVRRQLLMISTASLPT